MLIRQSLPEIIDKLCRSQKNIRLQQVSRFLLSKNPLITKSLLVPNIIYATLLLLVLVSYKPIYADVCDTTCQAELTEVNSAPPAINSSASKTKSTNIQIKLEDDTDETRRYKVKYKGFSVGEGSIRIRKTAEEIFVHYRMKIEVVIFYVTVYSLNSEQKAYFTSDGTFLRAKTAADIDGEKHAVTANKTDNGYQITYNGKSREVKKSDFTLTTLNPVFSTPTSGDWLDLTNGQLVPYTVKKTPEHLQLTRPDGIDFMKHDSQGLLESLKSKTKQGILRLTPID